MKPIVNRRIPGLRYAGRKPVDDSAAFTPASISTAIHWYRADLGVTTSGGEVTVWADQISDNNMVTSGGEKGPVVNSANSDFNGQDTLEFNDDALEFTRTPDITSADDGIDVYYIIRPENAGATRGWAIMGSSASPTVMTLSSGNILDDSFRTVRINGASSASGVTGAYRLVSKDSPSEYTAYYNETQIFTSAAGAYYALAGTNNRFGLNTSATGPGSAGYYLGQVAEIIMFDGTLADADKFLLHAYLNTRYGLSLATS